MQKNPLNEELLKIKKYITLLENYETTAAEREDPVRSAVSYPVFEEEEIDEMYDETGNTTPYGEDTGVITPKFVEEKEVKTMDQSELYHAILSQALERATAYAESKGYTVDADEMFNSFGTGGVSYGQTKRGYLTLYKNGLPAKKKLAIQIYRMPSGNYELNRYINERHLTIPEDHNQFELQMNMQKLFEFLDSKNKEVQLLKKVLYENGLYMKLIKLKSGKMLENRNEILGDIKELLIKLEMPLNEHIKAEMIHLIDNLMIPAEVSEESPRCACEEMNETITVASIIKEAKKNKNGK